MTESPRPARSRLPLLLGGCAALLVLGLVAAFLAARPLLGLLGAASPTQTSAVAQVSTTASELATPTADSPTPAAQAATPTILPSPTQAAVPSDRLYVRIDNITVENNRYVVTYETFGFTEELPGINIHFFFNTVPPDQAGLPGNGPWQIFGGPRPFKGFALGNRPPGATQMCALVANPDHTVQADSGNCYDLPAP